MTHLEVVISTTLETMTRYVSLRHTSKRPGAKEEFDFLSRKTR